ncbi:MAG: hypothetical protein IV094_11805 [Vitreoscilla sp.]|nr:hypothetical protein [Vitreoscilla sp.]
MDQDKFAFFVAKFRAFDDEEFLETCQRSNSLAEEAEAAVRQVASERGTSLPDRSSQDTAAAGTELTDAERREQTRQSTELWNGSLSKRVQLQFAFHAIVFSGALLGTSGLRFGALWLLALCVALYYPANKIGRSYTRSICANGETSVEQKRASLRTSSLVLWPTLVVAAMLGAGLANMLRGA